MKRNTLHYGDCLEVMREWPDACVDLIYLDPPFNSNANYNILFGNKRNGTGNGQVHGKKDLAQMVAFTDTWEWDEKTAERIVTASSNEGDVVLDPFCGGGTTIEVAMNLRRDFVGIDISMYALDIIQKKRLKDIQFTIDGVPAELSSAKDMAMRRPFAFEKWAIHCIPGFVSNNKQSGDGGVDGWAALLHTPQGENGMCIAQVKGGTPSVDAIRAFTSKLLGSYASIGVFITLEKWDTPTVRKCIADAGKLTLGATSYNRLVMWSVEEYFAAVKPPLPPIADPQTGLEMQTDLLTQTKLRSG